MISGTNWNQFKYDGLNENVLEKSESSKTDLVEDLQAKILLLETELKKQKEAAERGAKLLKLMWGDKFETDSLH